MLSTVDGLVLRARDYGENDRLITILTSDGKMTVIAKGARSLKSKIKNLTEPFVYANFELNQKGTSIAWIKGGSIEQSFYDLRTDVEKLFLATYICEVASELSGERVDSSDILRLTLNTLFSIMNGIRPMFQIKAVFELRASAMSGYAPSIDYCEDCMRSELDESYFDIMNGAVVCSECLGERGRIVKKNPSLLYDDIRERQVLIPLNPATLAALRYTLHSPSEKMLSFALANEGDLESFSKACEAYLLHHLGHGFDSLDLYYSIL